MSFILKKGRKPELEYYPKKASTEFTIHSLVYADGSGNVQPADSTSGDHIGVIQESVSSSDDDYADNTLVGVMLLTPNMVFEATVTGTFTSASVGNQYDLSNAYTVNADGTSKKVVTCVGYISSTKGLFKVNSAIENADVSST